MVNRRGLVLHPRRWLAHNRVSYTWFLPCILHVPTCFIKPGPDTAARTVTATLAAPSSLIGRVALTYLGTTQSASSNRAFHLFSPFEWASTWRFRLARFAHAILRSPPCANLIFDGHGKDSRLKTIKIFRNFRAHTSNRASPFRSAHRSNI